MVGVKYALVTTATSGCQATSGTIVNHRSECRMAVVQYSRKTVEAVIASSCAMMGVAELKEKHKEAIKFFVKGNDVLVILPTGYRKSLCFPFRGLHVN